MKTYPLPGTIKFDAAHLSFETAYIIASDHYDVASIAPACDSSGAYYGVRTLSGFSALIGMIGGKPFILHKRPDGTRELEPVALP